MMGFTNVVDEKALEELREAWVDMPFDGKVPQGWGDRIQRLLNAVSAVVDPNRTLREDAEVKRRGDIAGYRQRHAFAVEQVKQAEVCGLADLGAQWTETRDREAAECLAKHGIAL